MMEKTYFMIKPEIVAAGNQMIGAILAIVNTAGFRITHLEMKQFDLALVEEFYAEHEGKPFFGPLCDYITSGPVVAVGLERDNAVSALRTLIGKTNPEEAATGTVRDLYGSSLQQNAVHASANPGDAVRELGLVFRVGA